MFRPFLLVGIGGSGGKTLRTLREDLTRRLTEAGWKNPHFPRCWQMLHVDVPSSQDGDDADLPKQLPIECYQGLVARNIVYRNLDDTLIRRAGAEARNGLAGWRPEPREVSIPVDKGAGQYRAIGRLITLASLAHVKEGLERAMDDLQSAEIPGELADLSRAFGADPSVNPPAPTPIVISSLAGGSGAGAVLDVCDALRALRPAWGDHSIGLLFAPDVFDEIPPELRKGVRPNALAALAELLAGFWNTSGPSPADDALMALGGIAAPNATRLGPRYPILVGKRNSKVDFGTQVDVYKAMGRALGAWLTSDQLQDTLGAYFQTNWVGAAGAVPDDTPLKTQGQEPPFSARGFARVSLGRDRFREYAAQRLAREAVERVLRRHLELLGREDRRSDEEVLAEHVDYTFGPFLAKTGLNERGREHNDVLLALKPSDRDSRLRQLENAVHEQVRMAAADKPRDRRWWRDRIFGQLREREDAAVREELEAIQAAARRWVRTAQDTLTSLVAQTVADEGAPATARLLSKLREEMEGVLQELPSEIEALDRTRHRCQQDVDGVPRHRQPHAAPAHPRQRAPGHRGSRETGPLPG